MTGVDYESIATQLVDDELGSTGALKMGSVIHDWCVATVAKRLSEIDKLTNGIVQYGPDGETSFLSADPLKPVRTVINQYRGIGGFG